MCLIACLLKVIISICSQIISKPSQMISTPTRRQIISTLSQIIYTRSQIISTSSQIISTRSQIISTRLDNIYMQIDNIYRVSQKKVGSQKISNCSKSLNFEAKINCNTIKQNVPKWRKTCIGLKFYLLNFYGPQSNIHTF